MKKLIYISGIACANLMLFGSLFKVLHWPGANILIIVSVTLFCFHFLPSALISAAKNEGQKKYKELYITTFVVFFIGMMGVLFKVLHWPGASLFLLVGIPLPFVLFLPVYLFQTRNDNEKNSTHFLGLMCGLIFLAVFSALLALNPSKSVLNSVLLNVEDHTNYATYNQLKTNSTSSTNPIKKSSDDLYHYIENLKCEIIALSGNSPCNNNMPKTNSSSRNLVNMDNSALPKHILFEEGEYRKIDELKSKIRQHRNLLLELEKTPDELVKLINAIFDVADRNQGEHITTWEDREFRSYELVIVLDILSQIQSNVRFVEAELL